MKVAFTFGRFNPPTVGHEKLIIATANVARKEGGEYFIFTDENYDFIQNNVKNIAGEFHAHNAVEHDMHSSINICKYLKELGFQVWVNLL